MVAVRLTNLAIRESEDGDRVEAAASFEVSGLHPLYPANARTDKLIHLETVVAFAADTDMNVVYADAEDRARHQLVRHWRVLEDQPIRITDLKTRGEEWHVHVVIGGGDAAFYTDMYSDGGKTAAEAAREAVEFVQGAIREFLDAIAGGERTPDREPEAKRLELVQPAQKPGTRQ